jgi:hypothetical protein
VRQVSREVRGAREVQAHGDLLIARWGCARARFTVSVGLKGIRPWLERGEKGGRRGEIERTSMDGICSGLDLEKGRLRVDRRRAGV